MLKHLLLILLICSGFQNLLGQQHKSELEQAVDSILDKKPESYYVIHKYLRPFRKDTSQLKQLIKRFDEEQYLLGKAYAENSLGIAYRNFSMYDQAIQTHQQAIKTAIKAHNIEFHVLSLNMLGVDYRRIEANRTALDYNQKALMLAETVENPSTGLKRSIAVSHNSMGNIYLLLKQYDLAIKQFKKALSIEKSINNQLGVAINYNNIGIAKEETGKIEEALAYYQESARINDNLNNEIGKIISGSSIAGIYIKQGRYKEALQLIKDNLRKTQQLNNPFYLTSEYISLGWAQTKLKLYSKAEKNLKKGLEIAKKHRFQSAISDAYMHLSEFYENKKEYRKSLEYYKLSIEYEKKVTNEKNIQYVNDLIIKYESEQKNNRIKELAKQNEITQLKLERNRNLGLLFTGLLLLLGVVLFALFRYQKLNNEKQIISLEQDAMRSQMNPHFIFNSLNAIKLYIINNEQKNAVYYLNKFSKLIRRILSGSREKEISLADEIETIKLYLEIENIRFLNEIKTEISLDNQLNTNTIKLPALILQAFIENAIWHGLSPKKGSKSIQVSFKKTGKTHLEICITDNGIGRKESAAIKSKKLHKRESVGIKLTEERLSNFYKNYKYNYSLEFIDLKDANGKSSGTKVILKIPLE